MRIRKQFAGIFVGLLILAAFLGLAPSEYQIPTPNQSDKALHFITFFLLTLCFYWIIETNRRRTLQLTIVICTLGLGVGSEVVQALLPNGRQFDPWDIFANFMGSGLAVGLCTWYHKRMLERRRVARGYNVVAGEDEERDLELGEGVGTQETGIIGASGPTVDEELDAWDENAEDWEDTDAPAAPTAPDTKQ